MLTSDHPLSTLILGLRADLTDKQRSALAEVMGSEACPWEELLALGNLHRVTLLWYLRLQQHGLTRQMPADLRDYLDALLEENRARNNNLLAALDRCLAAFSRDGIDVILLKGAAALADDLYGDLGARLMSDIDLLIKPEQLEQVEQSLLGLGFQIDNEDQDSHRSFHHHLPPYLHPDWHVCVEIHQNITSCRERNSFPIERLFGRAESLQLGAWPVKALHVSDRLLHNACHAVLRDGGWFYSWCSLHEWAEWDLLLRRTTSVDFTDLLNHAREGSFAEPLKVYALMSNRLFGSPVPADWCGRRETRHINRFLTRIAWRGSSARVPAVVWFHTLLQVLPRSWSYHSFDQQQVPLLSRMFSFLKLTLHSSSWKRLRLK